MIGLLLKGRRRSRADDRPIQPSGGPRRNGEAQMALILIGLIVLPSGLLGYLSWRAIERERSYSEERMRESYRRIARLAGLEIDRELHALEGRWAAELDAEAGAVDPSSASAAGGREPLVAARFVIAAPGRVVVPRVSLGRDVAGPGTDEEEIRADEHERFDRWITHGEELEYKARDFSGAIGWYRGAAARATSTRLKAMAQSYIGRVQLKSGDATAALATYGDLLAHYPEARDLNRMYLRFLAQYQRAVALEGLGRDREAVETLLELNQDLLRRSDAINQVQYAYYRDLIQDLMPRLLSSPTLTDPVTYEREFQRLRDQTKKRIGDRYLVQLLDGELSKMVLRRRHHATRLRYLSDRGQEDPFLIVYRTLPDAGGVFVRGLVAAQLDLTRLHQELLPTLAKGLGGDGASLAILGPGGEFVFGPSHLGGSPIATAALKGPFDFWQVGVFLADVPGAIRRLDLRSTLWLWLVCLLLATILFASSMFIGRARRQAYLARAQTTFVSNVTHELRTPLTSIKMLAELLEMEWTGPTADAPERRAAAAQYLAIIQRECDRLSRLIDRVLDFSRMEQRARTYRFETQELAPALAEVVESFRPHAEAEGFVLQLSIDADLPAVRLDADAFAQVMHNLLGNAVRYSENEREIRVRAYRSGHRVAVDVEDRGIGISKHELPRLFDRFFTGDPSSTARGQGGLGLGLTLSHGIVRAHGGEIKVASKVGRGSTFTVLLPPAPAGSVVAGNGERAEARREAGGAS